MAKLIGLAVALALFWLGLSGHYTVPILPLGGVALVFTLWLVVRMKILDSEMAPYFLIFSLLGYWLWLMKEIVRANLVVIRAAVKAVPDIEPALVTVPTTCRSDLARTIFANSITLTPGTVTVDVQGGELLVHALYARDAAPGAFDEMDRRVRIAVDGKKKK